MNQLKWSTLFICLVVLAVECIAQRAPDEFNTKMQVEFLKKDFTTLRNKLESSQPGLYLYTSKDSLDGIFNSINSSLTEPLTSIEFFRRIAPLNGILRNLHTRVSPSATFEKALETELPRFPIDIHWVNNKMYILRNHSANESLKEGSVIKSINGEQVGNICQTILACRIRDGFNESFPLEQTSRNFSYYYGQHIGTPDSFTIELTTSEGLNETVNVHAVTGSQITHSRVSKYKRKYNQYSEDWGDWIAAGEPALGFEIKEDVAMLRLLTFHTYTIEANGQKYEEFITKAFADLAATNTKNLIIDLRNSHGGHDLVGMKLMSHLHDSVFYYYKRRSAYLKPIGKSVKKGDGYEIVGRRGWIGKVTPAEEIFKGSVYVLMNSYSVSATGEFVGHLKNIKRAIFIGEEAGGNPVIFTGGQSLSIDLPHSRLKCVIPLHLVEMNVNLKNTGHGVIPDYEVHPTFDDILKENDVEMEFVLKLIRDRSNQN